jgi:transposase
MQYISLDAHKHYSLVTIESEEGHLLEEKRIEHVGGAIKKYLSKWDGGSPVAVETIGNWYWIIDEIEAAGLAPKLVHAGKAKLLRGMGNKTDKLDNRGMNRLQRNGTLPEVWIPPGGLRDKRDLPRTRMVLVRHKTGIKNRIHSVLAKYAVPPPEYSDIFGKSAMKELKRRMKQLPPQTAFSTRRLIENLQFLQRQVVLFEKRMKEVFKKTREIELLMTLPGVGFILSVVIAMEVGDVERFPCGQQLASYSGTVPRVHSSGGKTRHGRLRQDVNRYLKGAFMEAANAVNRHRSALMERHVEALYSRVRSRKNHQKAIGAVARHLAEATFHVLKKGEPYRDPCLNAVLPTGA